MKKYNIFLLFLYFISIKFLCVQSLNCVVCTQCASPWNNVTLPATTCAFGMDTCLASSLIYPGGSFIIKQCTKASDCTTKSYGLFGYGFFVNCCAGDSCNAAPAKHDNTCFLTLVGLLFYFIIYFRSK